MKIAVKEYNVVPSMEEKNEMNIVFVDNKLIYNNQEIQDENKIKSINELINKYRENIIKLNSTNIENYKGGRQEMIAIQFDDIDQIYHIIGNTPSEESSNLYNIIKDNLISIIEK